jgi:phosphatidylglycerol:prolipoprotein diacylglycerol transferase
VSLAVFTFEFDPLLRLGDSILVRWQTVALVAIVFVGLLLAGRTARRMGLRPDDLLFIAVAIVPGAVIGGRLGYVLLHLDYYGANRTAVLDPAQGSLELSLAVVGGVLSGSYVAALLGAPIGAWLRAGAAPALFMLGAGKLAMVLGGAGQGQPTAASWATAFAGPGPWGSLAPEVPAIPSQALEGIAALLILGVLAITLAVGAFRARDARLFLAGVGAWAIARAIVSLTWRDAVVLGPFNAGGVIALVVAATAGVAWLIVARRTATRPVPELGGSDVDWADPATRPRF